MELVYEDCWIQDTADITNVPHGTVQAMLKSDFSVHRIAVKFMPKILLLAQEAFHVKFC